MHFSKNRSHICRAAVGQMISVLYLCGCIHRGTKLQQFSNNLYMALFGGKMKSVQTILTRNRMLVSVAQKAVYVSIK